MVVIVCGILAIEASFPFISTYTPTFRGVPLSITTRWVMTLVGIIFIIDGVFCRRPKSGTRIVDYERTICPKCEHPFEVGRVPKNGLCSNCQVPVEPIKGYYDRHPERRDVEEKNIKPEDEEINTD